MFIVGNCQLGIPHVIFKFSQHPESLKILGKQLQHRVYDFPSFIAVLVDESHCYFGIHERVVWVSVDYFVIEVEFLMEIVLAVAYTYI